MRNMRRILIAEDNHDIQNELSMTFEKVGGFICWMVSKVADIPDALVDSNAFWAIFDLELEDGNTFETIKQVKDLYGDEIRIIVYTGYYEKYTELAIWNAGADILRKPINPLAILKKIEMIEEQIKGIDKKSARINQTLKIGEDAYFDMVTGYCKVGGNRIYMPENVKNVMRSLASSYQPDQTWEWLSRFKIMQQCEGLEKEPVARQMTKDEHKRLKNSPVAMQSNVIDTIGERLRKYTQKIREVFGPDVIEIQRTADSSSVYRFSNIVTFITEEEAKHVGMRGDNA